ncbi:MAG: hypothetical protein IT427_05695 [Pirellulales bacterium]|nr:hypothetical protein [Pirellulales bacterium]
MNVILLALANQVFYSLPLIVSVSLVYAATRHEEMTPILAHALRFGAWIVSFMLALGVFLWWLGKGL